MQYTTATGPRWADAAQTAINLTVTFLVGEPQDELAEGEEAAVDARTPTLMPFTATPNDPAAHGRELFARAVAGDFGAIAAYVPPAPIVPRVISRFQGRAALYQAGRLEDVQDYMDRADTPMLHKLAWIDAQEWERESATVAVLADVLVLTSAQVDQLFITGAGIKA